MVGALHLNLFMKSVIQTNLRRFSMFRHFVDVNSIPEMKDEHECRHHIDAGTLVPLNNVRDEVFFCKTIYSFHKTGHKKYRKQIITYF